MISLKKVNTKRIIGVILVGFILLIVSFRSKSYEIVYTRDAVSVVESYSKKDKLYTFLFQIGEKEFFATFKGKYKHAKKFVDKVVVNEKDNTICILPEGAFSFFPICMKNDEYVSFHLIQDDELVPATWHKDIEDEERTFGNLKIYHLNQHKYYVWNYKGFTVIDEKSVREISLFQEDIYNIPLGIQVDKYILLADYSSKYEFNKFYVIHSKNNKVRELVTERNLPFDSYFLGVNGKKAYFVDKKNKLEYEIYPKRLLINKVTNNNQGKILVNGEWESISMTHLVTDEKKFSSSNQVSYVLDRNTLYSVFGKYKTKLSDKNVKEIVFSDATTVYYLVEDKLYYYNSSEGEVLVLSNFEWNFNYKNMIYIF